MKRKVLIYLLISIALLLPNVIYAADINASITGSVMANPGDVIAYDIKISVPDDVTATSYSANIEYNHDILELRNVASKDWVEKTGNSNLNFYYENGINGTSTIATITFKVKDNVPKQVTDILLTDINVITLDEDESESINSISSTSSHKISLSIKSNDNTLSDLKIDGITIEGFESDKDTYDIKASSKDSSVELKGILNSSNARFVDGFGNRKVDLEYGENEVMIKVQAETGEVKTYTIKITREDDRNTNNNLKEIIINYGKIKIELEKDVTDYVVKTYKLKSLDVTATAADPKATVNVEIPDRIIVGENVVVVTVTSEIGEVKYYSFTFENSETVIDTKLKGLYIKDCNIDFDKNTMVYNIAYNKKLKEGLDIKAVPVSTSDLVSYKVYYNGQELQEAVNVSLKIGDKYEIEVYPLGLEDGNDSESSIYVINIVRDARISFFLLLGALILLVLLVLIIIQLVKRYKNKKILANPELIKELSKMQSNKKE